MVPKNGYLYLAGFFFLDSFFPIFAYFAQKSLPTLWLVSLSMGVSFLCGLGILLGKKLYLQYKNKKILVPTLLSSFFMGAAMLLYFFGVEYSSPSTASVLLLLQSLFAFILFNIFGKESYNYKQILGAILLFIGGATVAYEGENIINIGAGIMILSCILFTLGNYYTKKASILGANPFFLLVNRNLITLIFSTILAMFFIGPINVGLISENILWILGIGVLVLFLAKSLWVVALTKLNSFVAISSLPMIPVLVMFLSFIILGEIPTNQELLGFIPIGLGTIFLVKK